MSQSEVERFVSDLKSDATLREDLKGSAAGIATVVTFAQSRGYDIGADEARQYIQAQMARELSDDQLDAIAGGKGHFHVGKLLREGEDLFESHPNLATNLGVEVVVIATIVAT